LLSVLLAETSEATNDSIKQENVTFAETSEGITLKERVLSAEKRNLSIKRHSYVCTIIKTESEGEWIT
jgi:hypothetical protein